jgi:hypothetical protein
MRWVGFAIGLLIVVYTTGSVIGTLIVPRRVRSIIAKTCDQSIDVIFRAICPPRLSYPRRDSILAWQAPLSLVLRLLVWLALLYLGYALLLLPIVSDDAGRAFSEAGSSMFTLGYSAPAGGATTALDYLAAFTGLIVVGLQIGYLPTLYAAFNRRETEVTLLVSRAGLPAWGPELLARTRFGFGDEVEVGAVLDPLFITWERWSAEVAESHSTYLTLTQFRSPRPLSHWVTSLIAVMDAAAMHLALSPTTAPTINARLCLRMGFTAMAQVGTALNLTVTDDPDPDHPLTAVSFADFATAADMLRTLGYPVERTNEEAWPHFRGWRVNYESVALALAYATNAPPALWSGPRRWPSTPLPPGRPANRQSREVEPSARAVAYDSLIASAPSGSGPAGAAPDRPGAAG